MIRYPVLQNKNTWKSKHLGETAINLLEETFVIPENFEFSILKIDDSYIARPDLISLDAYGDVAYADVICKLNGISNPFELNAGDYILLPAPSWIDNFYVFPDPEDEEDTPKPKRKSEPRSPGEALIGDTRFKIDSNKGVIFY